jgi:hypothetical protein
MTRNERKAMSTTTIAGGRVEAPESRQPQIRADVQFVLDNLDERIQAVEFSESYAKGLTRDEWVAITAAAHRNGVPVRILEQRAA